jgi:raffinose/stachyose/melibiose transport system substrate-binding protein
MIKKTLVLMLLLLLIAVPIASTVQAQDTVTLTYLVDNSEANSGMATALAEAYMAQHPNVEIIIELRPGGTEGDNLVKTRLATGDMTDVFWYNSGSLLQALNPNETLVDLSDQPFIENIVESFLPTVSSGDAIFGVPSGTAMGGGILYNRVVYEDLGLEVPQTWGEFVANNEVIAEAGIAPVLATFGSQSTWTSQLFVLADHYNVEQGVPGFSDAYTLNEATIADTPAAMAGFEHLQQGYELGWWQEDYATEEFEPGLELLATGEVAHYPMLTFVLSTIATNFPDQAEDIGFFAQPGSDPEVNGVTLWMPPGTYIPQTTEGAELEAALDFLAFIASVEGADILTEEIAPTGPYMIVGASLPDTVLPAVQDLASYIESGNSYPALEFVSPVKGPNLQQITVAVGTGQMDAQQAAEDYDLDVERQAQQLGLPGWD